MPANNTVQVSPGTKSFEHLVFQLTKAVNPDSLKTLNYRDGSFQNVKRNVYAMPAYITKNLKLFFILSKLIDGKWIISFVKANVIGNHEVTSMSEPMTTGKGLNLIGKRSQKTANRMLNYFSTLKATHRGTWRLAKTD